MYWNECVTLKTTYNGHGIYKNEQGRFVVRFRFGLELGEDINEFSTMKAAKGFIDRTVIPEWDLHLMRESTDYATMQAG